MIRSIKAVGVFVEINSDEDGKRYHLRRSILERARGLRPMLDIPEERESARMFIEAFIRSCAQAYKNEYGRDYSSFNVDLWLNTDQKV